MKYRKASEVLPDALLKEVSKYVEGETLYFPKNNKRKTWGENTGTRQYYKLRNNEIKSKYLNGDTIEGLAKTYNLSVESVKKIIYK